MSLFHFPSPTSSDHSSLVGTEYLHRDVLAEPFESSEAKAKGRDDAAAEVSAWPV